MLHWWAQTGTVLVQVRAECPRVAGVGTILTFMIALPSMSCSRASRLPIYTFSNLFSAQRGTPWHNARATTSSSLQTVKRQSAGVCDIMATLINAF